MKANNKNYQPQMSNLIFTIVILIIFNINVIYPNKITEQDSINTNNLVNVYSDMADNIYKISESYYYQGRLDDAVKLLTGMNYISELDEMPANKKLLIVNQLGKMYAFSCFTNNTGYNEANEFLNKALALSRKTNDGLEISNALTFLGFTYYSLKYNKDKGDYETPLGYFTEALKFRKRLNDTRGIAESYIYIGIINERKGDAERALTYYKNALEISDKFNHKLEKSYATRHIAFIRQANNDLDGALDYFLQSLALREEVGFKIYLHFSNLSVGGIYEAKKEYDKAINYYNKAYNISKELNAKRVRVLASLSLADVYTALNKITITRKYLDEALSLSKEINYMKGEELASERLSKIAKE